MVTRNAIRRLKKELPRGFSGVIRTRLIAKGLRAYAIRTICATLNENDPRFNETIFNEAIEYRDFLRARKLDMVKKVFSKN